jgi:hypothetical protein
MGEAWLREKKGESWKRVRRVIDSDLKTPLM